MSWRHVRAILASASEALPWSAEEQAALASALKSVPADDAERWDRVASLVGTRTRKECMIRAKELATLLKQH